MFAAAVAGAGEPAATWSDGLRAAQIVEAALDAARSDVEPRP